MCCRGRLLDWNKKSMRSLESVYSPAFYEIFTTFDKNVVQSTMPIYMGLLPINLLIDLHKLNFLI